MMMPMVGKSFEVELMLGAGGFGQVYLGLNVKTGADVAIKLEPYHAEHKSLEKEANVYKQLGSGAPSPACHWYGSDMFGQTVYNVLVLDLMGPSLSKLLDVCGGRFNEKTVLLLAPQIVGCIQFLHGVGFIHGDVKPGNFVIGPRHGAQHVCVIDFGLATAFNNLDPITSREEHIPFKEGCSWAGTSEYASINALLGMEQSRRDDLEAVGYMLITFQQAWQQYDEEDYGMLRSKIQAPKKLCQDLSSEFADYLEYCRDLGFEECPDYAFLKSLFKHALAQKGFEPDAMFEWIETPEFSDYQDTGNLAMLRSCFDFSENRVASIARRTHTSPCSPSVVPAGSPQLQFDIPSSPQLDRVPEYLQVGLQGRFYNGSSEHLQDMSEWFYNSYHDLQTTGLEKARRQAELYTLWECQERYAAHLLSKLARD